MQDKEREVVIGRTYRHCHGLRYRVDSVGLNTTGYERGAQILARFVTYTQLEDGKFPAGTVWVREEQDFLGKTSLKNGQLVNTFELAEEERITRGVEFDRSRIVPMTVGHLPRVMELQMAQEVDTGTGAPQAYSRETLTSAIEEPKDSILLVALSEDREVIGFSLSSILSDLKDAYLHSLVVDQSFRGQGVARALVGRTLDMLEQTTGVNHPFCVVKTSNIASQGLLESEGFARGEEPFYYYDRTLPRSAAIQ